MADYGVTDQGFVLKRYDVILDEIQTSVSIALGFDVSQNPQSLLNAALLVPFADKIASLWEVAQDSYYAKYPATASGVNLDNACQYGNVYRESATHTTYNIHVTAVDGTTIPKDSIIASTTNPVVKLTCVQDTEVSRSACHAIVIRTVVQEEATYTITFNDQAYSYDASDSDDEATILGELMELLAADLDEYTLELGEDDGYLYITDTSNARDNEIVLSENLTTETVTSCVYYYTEDYGEVYLPVGAITVIVSNVTDMISVYNAIDPEMGRQTETDTELRLSYLDKIYNSASSQCEAIESYILSEIEDTKAVRCYENATDEYDDYGRPPHSIEVIVDGGNEDEIAAAILKKKAGGINTFGDNEVSVLGAYGDTITIRYNRPESVYVWVNITITQGSVNISSDYEDTVKEIILETTDMTIGDDFLSQSYISAIYEAFPGIQYVDIKVATGTASALEEDYYSGNVSISERQIADLDSARIEVTLV